MNESVQKMLFSLFLCFRKKEKEKEKEKEGIGGRERKRREKSSFEPRCNVAQTVLV
jgi:hypothetical protein